MQKKFTIHIEMSHISYSLELVLCANIVTWFLRKQNWTYNTTHSVQLHQTMVIAQQNIANTLLHYFFSKKAVFKQFFKQQKYCTIAIFFQMVCAIVLGFFEGIFYSIFSNLVIHKFCFSISSDNSFMISDTSNFKITKY